MQGLCEEEAHNAAWDETDFESRYRDHLAGEEAATAVQRLANRVEDGASVALVCFEGKSKRCHRRVLDDVIRGRVGDDDR